MTFGFEALDGIDFEIFGPEHLPESITADSDFAIVIPPPAQRQIALLHWLSNATIPELRTIAQGMGWTLRGRRRSQILPQLLEYYGSADSLREPWQSLSQAEHNLLAALVATPPGSFEQIEGMIEAVLLWSPSDWPLPDDPIQATGDLIERGFVHALDEEFDEVVLVSPGFAALAPPLPFLPVAQVVEANRSPSIDPVAALWSATLVLGESDETPAVPTSPAGTPGTPEQWPSSPKPWGVRTNHDTYIELPPAACPFSDGMRARVRDLIGNDEVGIARFYLAMAYLLEHAPDLGSDTLLPEDSVLNEQVAARERAPHSLDSDAPLLLQQLLAQWSLAGYALCDELALASERGPTFLLARIHESWCGPEDYARLLSEWRTLALYSSSLLAPARGNDDGWIEAGPFLAFLIDLLPFAFQMPLDASTFMLLDQDYTFVEPIAAVEHHHVIKQAWTTLWQGPMRWLGLVETAVDRRGALAALRLTPAALHFIGRPEIADAVATEATSASDEALPPTWEPDLRISTPVGGAGALRSVLARWTETEGVSDSRMHHRFTARRAQAAFEAGQSPDDLRAGLAPFGLNLPDSHGATLDRWWARWGLVHRYDDLAIVELASPMLQREMLADDETARLVLRPIGDRALAVLETNVPRLLERLERRGYRPMVVEGRS
jgi:hypothetical protein